jgi:hypothetical protein
MGDTVIRRRDESIHSRALPDLTPTLRKQKTKPDVSLLPFIAKGSPRLCQV